MPIEAVFADLARVRAFLAASPVAASLEESLVPLGRAIESLLAAGASRAVGAPSWEDRERLGREVKQVGELLAGVEQWLTANGALAPTYNRRAEWATDGMAGARGAGLMAEG